jgi:hypothetical protein
MAVRGIKPGKHLFTSKKMSMKALYGDCFGGISVSFAVLTLWLTFQNGGKATAQYAAGFFLTAVLAVAGMVLSVLSRREPDRYYFFSYLGMFLNGLVLALAAVVLYYGARI